MDQNYNIFKEYPDVVDFDTMRKMLGGIGKNLAYSLLHSKKIYAIKLGRAWLITKANIIKYLYQEENK